MCGIAGYLGPKREGLLDRMVNAIRSRGPDGSGVFSNADIEIGHTRLAIVDIAGGVQPMIRENNRYIVSYNGEIYNYRELRAGLESRGASIGAYDLLMAAQALRHGATLVTANTREFSRVPKLRWQDWTKKG